MTPERLAEIRRFTSMSSYELNCDPPTHDMIVAIEELLAHVDALEKIARDHAGYIGSLKWLAEQEERRGEPAPLTPCVGQPMGDNELKGNR